jgi:hypothetical protein
MFLNVNSLGMRWPAAKMYPMIFDKEVPLRFWLNRGVDETRRVRTEAMLEDVGMTAERFPVLQADRRKSPQQGRDMPDVPADDSNKAYILSQRLALREAARRGAPAVLLMGDHCNIHPNFKTLLGRSSCRTTGVSFILEWCMRNLRTGLEPGSWRWVVEPMARR